MEEKSERDKQDLLFEPSSIKRDMSLIIRNIFSKKHLKGLIFLTVCATIIFSAYLFYESKAPWGTSISEHTSNKQVQLPNTPEGGAKYTPQVSHDIGQITPEGGAKYTTQGSYDISQIKSEAIDLDYYGLYKQNEDYIGKIVHYKGGIVDIMGYDEYDPTTLDITSGRASDIYNVILATAPMPYQGYYDRRIWIRYKGETLRKGDIVEAWGRVIGLHSYTWLELSSIPEIEALHVEIVSQRGNIQEW